MVEPGGIEPVPKFYRKFLNSWLLGGDFDGECTKCLYQTHRAVGGPGRVASRDFLTQIPKGGVVPLSHPLEPNLEAFPFERKKFGSAPNSCGDLPFGRCF